MRGIIVSIFFFLPVALSAQYRFSKLTIKPHQIFKLGSSDILVADTLEMLDSSKIELSHTKTESYIRVNVAIFGSHAIIDGRGKPGREGAPGFQGKNPIGPCQAGGAGRNGNRGMDGGKGINLFLYIDKLFVNGNLVIDLSGGNGGDGAEGGEGGGGSPGTLHCFGGNGGKGGNGGNGGDGGNGGTLTFGGLDAETVHTLGRTSIIVNSLGGNPGYGGFYGAGGPAGLGPGRKNGKVGVRGNDGGRGTPGKNGVIQFEHQ
jgi:hypothetical protein